MKKGIFSVSQFAKLSQMTRDIVLNYDKLGLISPVRKGNNYRYYSSDQLAIANLVRIQLELGTPLAKIKQIVDQRTPESVYATLGEQLRLIDAKIAELKSTQKFVTTFQQFINSAKNVDEQEIKVCFLPEQTIILGEVNDYSKGGNDYSALHKFYDDIIEKYPNTNLNYPVWGAFSKERIMQKDWHWPDRYYSYNPDGADKRPAAQYAIGYTRGGYGQTDDVYERLLAYIDQNGYEICGDTYEEYPLNEVCISDDTNYLIKVMIAVREKN